MARSADRGDYAVQAPKTGPIDVAERPGFSAKAGPNMLRDRGAELSPPGFVLLTAHELRARFSKKKPAGVTPSASSYGSRPRG
jgi:hypothetical protein